MARPSEDHTDTHVDRVWPTSVVVALAAFAAVFLVVTAPDFSASFGHSDEGLNAAVWGYGSRSYREMGPIESVLGGRRTDGHAYATHPPGLLTETAFSEWIAGEKPWVTRAPAWIGALATIPLMYLLLRAIGARAVGSAAAVVAGLGTPMFFTYGWMLDTMVTGFPFGVATAVVWQRDRSAGRSPGLLGPLLALACALSSWQAALFAGLLGAWTIAEARTATAFRRGAPILAGVLCGLTISLAWGAWVYGDLGALYDKLLLRSVGERSGLGDLASYQGRWLTLLAGLGLIGLAACFASTRDERWRPIAAISLSTVVGYMLLFRGAAASHPFWNYWVLLPITIGYGYAFEQMRERQGAASNRLVVTLAVGAALVGIVPPGAAKGDIRAGTRAAEVLTAHPPPATQVAVPYLGGITSPDDWILYATDLPSMQLKGVAELRSWALDHPGEIVLVVGPCPPHDVACTEVWNPAAGDYQVLTSEAVIDRLPGA